MNFAHLSQAHLSNVMKPGGVPLAPAAVVGIPTAAQLAFENFHSGGSCDKGVVSVLQQDLKAMLMTMFVNCQLSNRVMVDGNFEDDEDEWDDEMGDLPDM